MAVAKVEKSAHETRSRFGEGAGLASLRPGFAWTADHDALFALGWPHLRLLVDGHRDDEAPVASARRILLASDPPARIAWPRRASAGLVRALGLPSIYELAPGVRGLRREAEEAVWATGTLSPAEAADLVARRVTCDVAGLSERGIETFVLLLEALVGTEVVGGAILDALESLDADALLGECSRPPVVTWNLGFLMLRAPAPLARAWRARLEAVLERALDAEPRLRVAGFRGRANSHARAAHLVLGGAAAADADTDHAPRWYAHAADDPARVRMRVAVDRLGHEPDARLVFLGGPDVLTRYARDWQRLSTFEAQRWLFEQMAPIRGPEALALMLALAARSRVRDDALAWFRARGTEGDAFLAAAAAADGPAGGWAREVRKALGA